MQFFTNDSLILTPHLNQSFALRRNVRIKSSKLPPDFFLSPHPPRYAPSPILSRQIGTDISNRDARTPSFQLRKREPYRTNLTIELERKVETARPSLQKIEDHEQLISGVLSSSHKLHRVFRKQSMEMKDCYSVSVDQKHLRLPKILNKAVFNKF